MAQGNVPVVYRQDRCCQKDGAGPGPESCSLVVAWETGNYSVSKKVNVLFDVKKKKRKNEK